LGKQIVLGLIAHPNGLDMVELVQWACGAERPVRTLGNIRRHCLMFGIRPIGKRSRRLVWALRKPDHAGRIAPSVGA
jgi:hypothetical protein